MSPWKSACKAHQYVAHEFGHAMFDLLQVPTFGSAENAADEFSTDMNAPLGPEARTPADFECGLLVSQRRAGFGGNRALQAYSDMHSMPGQRFFNLPCLADGADPTTFAHFVEEKDLAETRAHDCEDRFCLQEADWSASRPGACESYVVQRMAGA